MVLFEDGGLLYETMSAEDVEKIKVGLLKEIKKGIIQKHGPQHQRKCIRKQLLGD